MSGGCELAYPKTVRDGRRGELVVLEERESGLWRVAPAADPDRDYWIAKDHLRLRPPPRERGPKGPKRLVEGLADLPHWFARLLDEGWLFARVYPRFVAQFEDRYRGLTGLDVTGETPGVHYAEPRRLWCISAGVGFPLETDLEGRPPSLHLQECRRDGGKPYRRISSVALFWELVEAGARLGKRGRDTGAS